MGLAKFGEAQKYYREEKIGAEACRVTVVLHEEASNFEERTAFMAGTAGATLAQALVGQTHCGQQDS